jgi:hypothetical protein
MKDVTYGSFTCDFRPNKAEENQTRLTMGGDRPMTRPEYMCLKLSDILEEVIEHYNLRNIATPEGYVYCEVNKGMYGLPQSGIIAQELLEK